MDIAHTFPVHVDVDGPRPSSDLRRSVSYKTGFRLSNGPNFLELGCSSWTEILIGPDPDLNLTFIRLRLLVSHIESIRVQFRVCAGLDTDLGLEILVRPRPRTGWFHPVDSTKLVWVPGI